jgi:hypothetical protein
MNKTKKGKNKAAGVALTIHKMARPKPWNRVYKCIFIVRT